MLLKQVLVPKKWVPGLILCFGTAPPPNKDILQSVFHFGFKNAWESTKCECAATEDSCAFILAACWLFPSCFVPVTISLYFLPFCVALMFRSYSYILHKCGGALDCFDNIYVSRLCCLNITFSRNYRPVPFLFAGVCVCVFEKVTITKRSWISLLRCLRADCGSGLTPNEIHPQDITPPSRLMLTAPSDVTPLSVVVVWLNDTCLKAFSFLKLRRNKWKL